MRRLAQARNPTSRITGCSLDSPMCNCTSEVRCFASPRNDGREREMDVTRADPEIRLLTCADALAYRDIRLEGLRRHPEAFASTFEDERDSPMDRFKELITQSQIFGAVVDQKLVGVVGLRAYAEVKLRHKAMIWGMY